MGDDEEFALSDSENDVRFSVSCSVQAEHESLLWGLTPNEPKRGLDGVLRAFSEMRSASESDPNGLQRTFETAMHELLVEVAGWESVLALVTRREASLLLYITLGVGHGQGGVFLTPQMITEWSQLGAEIFVDAVL